MARILSCRGKRIAVASGLVLGLVLLVAGLKWKDLTVGYYVSILRAHPDRLELWATASEGSLKACAVRKFLELPGGTRVLQEKFLGGFFELLRIKNKNFLPNALEKNQRIQFGFYELTGKGLFLVDGPTTLVLYPITDSPLVSLKPLFKFMGNGEFDLDEYPGVRCSIWSYREDYSKDRIVVEGYMVRFR